MHRKIPIDTATVTAVAAAVHDGILTTINHGERNNKCHRHIKISFFKTQNPFDGSLISI